ncbi:hypothetical protein PVAP13_4KG101102 [Panicum virgatum]|uniref:Uncharacterized protein n=1 Tax=Panicum virgatum TaxID=38727 RepID=A0A8T0TK79_PANVG|nr:hypothetical protein PVAP13_4KG101102 [Panicum virgatum]
MISNPSECMSGLVTSSPSCVFDGIKFSHASRKIGFTIINSRWLLKKKGCLGGNSFTQEKYATVQCCPQLSGLPNLVLVVQCPHCIILVRFQMFRFRSAMLDHLNTCTQESGQ